MGRCRECNRVLNYPEDDAIVDKQGILCIECGEGEVMSDKVYICGICENEEGEFIADNNADKVLTWYCGACEDNRSDRYGCALILAEGVMCQDGACGCGGKGVY
jgi:hypothetical protein